jgi:hypothetical protein
MEVNNSSMILAQKYLENPPGCSFLKIFSADPSAGAFCFDLPSWVSVIWRTGPSWASVICRSWIAAFYRDDSRHISAMCRSKHPLSDIVRDNSPISDIIRDNIMNLLRCLLCLSFIITSNGSNHGGTKEPT